MELQLLHLEGVQKGRVFDWKHLVALTGYIPFLGLHRHDYFVLQGSVDLLVLFEESCQGI